MPQHTEKQVKQFLEAKKTDKMATLSPDLNSWKILDNSYWKETH